MSRHQICKNLLATQSSFLFAEALHFLRARSQTLSWRRSATSVVNQIIIIISPSGYFATIYKRPWLSRAFRKIDQNTNKSAAATAVKLFSIAVPPKAGQLKYRPYQLASHRFSRNTVSSVCATSPRSLCFNFTPVDMSLSDAGYPSFVNWWWSRGEIARGLSVRSQMN